MSERTFLGYSRGDGRVGIRNHVAVISAVNCANHVAESIARKTGAVFITHDAGCLQIAQDRVLTERCIFGAGMSPNVGAVLFVGLGCEQTPAKSLAESVAGKPSRYVLIQNAGGTSRAVEAGSGFVEEMRRAIAGQERKPFEVSHLSVSLKCGGSDYTTALASNPATGVASDLLVKAGGGVFLTETTGLPGSEHLLARRAVNRKVARRIYEIVDFYRSEMKAHFNRSPNEGNPTPGNMAGGITTLVEKSYGTVMKGGHSPIQGVLAYAEDVLGKKGLWFMDTPGGDVFSVSGPTSGGCHMAWFTTGRGTPLGNPIMPVVKICGNPKTFEWMRENMDLNAGTIMTAEKSFEEVGQEILDFSIEVASGRLTQAEMLDHREYAIPRIGSTL